MQELDVHVQHARPRWGGGSLRAFRRAGKTTRGMVVVVTIVGVVVVIAVDVAGDVEFSKSAPNEVKLQVLLLNGLGLKVLSHFG